MLELIQVPWSPFCLVQRRILEYARARFRVVNVPNSDRSLVWRLTRQRYYQVPVLRDGRQVVFETSDDSQVIAKYLDQKFALGLFPAQWAGVQQLLWLHIEHQIEDLTFRLNDIYWRELVAAADRLGFVRHKERKFGKGCLEQWAAQQSQLRDELARRLTPFELMLMEKPFLLDFRPRFVDFDLFGMLANFLYSGHYRLPREHPRLAAWYEQMAAARCSNGRREKPQP
jgi:glutathione S-transferase